MKHWISAARPRTLPLALSSILMGSFLAAGSHAFSWTIFGLAVLTTTFLQVLSNSKVFLISLGYFQIFHHPLIGDLVHVRPKGVN